MTEQLQLLDLSEPDHDRRVREAHFIRVMRHLIKNMGSEKARILHREWMQCYDCTTPCVACPEGHYGSPWRRERTHELFDIANR